MDPVLSAVDQRPTVRAALAAARSAQSIWNETSLRERLGIVREARHRVAEDLERWVGAIDAPRRLSAAETISAEVLPLADALRFLEREAPRLLRPRRLGRRRRPFWLGGVRGEIRRDPLGVVLLIGPSNYPLLLPGVQAAQALVAGNAVLLKPGRGGAAAARALADVLGRAGLPDGLLQVLDESVATAEAAIEAGVDKVVLTGSVETGRRVLGRLARSITPAVVELSGCDPVFVRRDADLDLAARALAFGLRLNGGFTCIAPRRVYIEGGRAAALERRLRRLLRDTPAVEVGTEEARRVADLAREALAEGARIVVGELPAGGRMPPLVLAGVPRRAGIANADLASPVLSIVEIQNDEHAPAASADCAYRLGASVFGRAVDALEMAQRVPAGVVVVNDVIVPTADPRVPFGGSGHSGYGVTRGAEGLLALTRPKAILLRSGRFRPHLDASGPIQEQLLPQIVRIAHGRTWSDRLRAVLELARLSIGPSRSKGGGRRRWNGS